MRVSPCFAKISVAFYKASYFSPTGICRTLIAKLIFYNRTMHPWWLLDEKTMTQLHLTMKPLPRTHGDCLGRHRDNGNHPPKCAYRRDPLGRPGLSPGTTKKYRCLLPGPRKRVQGPRSPAGCARVTFAYQTCHLRKIYPYGI